MIYVLSDLHLWSDSDPFYPRLCAWLDARARGATGQAETLVLAGDIFDLFVWHKKVFLKRYDVLLQKMQQAAARGLKIYYVEGNHDFLLHQALSSVPGLVHCSDRALVPLPGGGVLLVEHGDLADSEDPNHHGYKRLRGFFRSPVMRFLCRVVPDCVLDFIGRNWSRYSREQTGVLTRNWSPDVVEKVKQKFRNYAQSTAASAEKQGHDVRVVVLGHTHLSDNWSFTSPQGRSVVYFNGGQPRPEGRMTVIEGGRVETRTVF